MKNTLSIFAILFLPVYLFSQNLSFGVFGGVNASFQIFSDNTNIAPNAPLEAKPGYVFGATTVIKLTDFLALRGGLNLARKGGKEEFNLTDVTGKQLGTSTLQTNIDYLQIPLLVEASLLKDRILFVNIGYGFGFLQKAKLKATGYPFAVTNDITELYRKADYSLLIGFGVKVPATEKIDFTFEGRWENGLSDVVKDNDITGKNRSVFAAAGFRYQL